ncbi:major facilitator superfamily domain protein [Fusarium sp. NRRL 52700]|nr:major facilitator superfamily domain protein [Fusarium sp. NRRL 52700]
MSTTNTADEKAPVDEQQGTASSIVIEQDLDESLSDVAAKFLAELPPHIVDAPITPEESRKLLWKIDLILLPLLGISVLIAAVDKVIISNAAIYGLTTDTKLVGNEFSWVGSIFYFGFLVAEWPGNICMQKLPIRSFYAATVLGWAILTFATGCTQNFAGLAAVRFLMGMFESVAFPICVLVSSMWWTISEQPLRTAIWFNNFSSIVTGLLSYGIGRAHTSVAPWRLLFFVIGAISTVWCVIIYICLPSSPVEAWWLNDREKFICLERTRKSNTGLEDKNVKWYQVKECLLDPKSWLIAIFACAINIPNGGFVTFAALIVSGMGFGPLETVLLGVPTGVIATIWSIFLNTIVGRTKNLRCIIIAGALAFPIASAICLWQLPAENNLSRLGAYYGAYSYWAPYVICTTLPMANTSGHSKKTTLNAMFFIGYCMGNILGPQVFRQYDAPEYNRGFAGLLASCIVAFLCISAYGVICFFENRRRDRVQGGGPVLLTEAELRAEAFSDKTDKEKLNFRYTY